MGAWIEIIFLSIAQLFYGAWIDEEGEDYLYPPELFEIVSDDYIEDNH